MQALMLAAGMGKRLAKWTKNNTKCMVEVAGLKLIDRAILALKEAGINKFIIVIGYKGENLKKYILDNYEGQMEFVFIDNKDYATTNNIYSFYLAREELRKDDTILLESDLIYDSSLIKRMVESPEKDIVAVAKYESWMDGTCVETDENDMIVSFIEKKDMKISLLNQYYKTVNVYKFSKEFLTDMYIPFLKAYMSAYGLDVYYETTLKLVCQLSKAHLKAFYMNELPWYEIDDGQDLDIANILFSKGADRYNRLMAKFGGYWRYSKFLDFYYLVNPYFPPKEMVEKMQNEFPILLTQYPSGLNMQNMNAERLFEVDKENILVGNGAAELINALGHVSEGIISVNLPTFNEYVRCFSHCTIKEINNSLNDYCLSKEAIKKAIDESNIVAIVNPENPSGFMFDKDEIVEISKYAKEKGVQLIIDESFADFADKERRYTLLSNEFIQEYPNVVIIKSISKSFGVPGLRLGLLATADVELIKKIRQDMQIWNINSFGEYYFQVYQLFAKKYSHACDCIADERNYMIEELSKIKSIKVYPSQANYIMIELKERKSYDFCVQMLDESNLLVKDLSTKRFFEGKNYIRVAVRDRHDNDILINKFKEVL